MDAQRFDNLARTLASRLSRRGALRRAGAGAAASLLAATSIRPDQAEALIQAQSNGQPLYTLIRRYTLGVPSEQVRQALQQGYVEDACRAPGFVAYLTVEDDAGDFATVAVFRSAADMQNFANAEANWIAQNLDDLLPAPDEAISGDTYVHGVAPQGFTNTCAAPPPASSGSGSAQQSSGTSQQQPAAPTQPTAPPAQPTAAPSGPTPTPLPACTAQGCICTTGTQAPCDDGLVCCPTTDLMGGPGVCQPQNACYPNDCRANGRACPRSCGTTEACPSCCSNYCNGNGVCDDPPANCTDEYCPCTPGASGACDSGLVCCIGTSSIGPVCATPAQCASITCPHQYCGCSGGVQGACDDGLLCCSSSGTPGGDGICLTQDECDPSCNGQGCGCNGGVQGACDDGFVCCQNGMEILGGAGACQPEGQCAPATCTGEGCTCTTGVDGACDSGLVCCGMTGGIPGDNGTCRTQAECDTPCTAEGCDCDNTDPSSCDQGLVCCAVQAGYICATVAQCSPTPCTAQGCDCNGGVQGACDDGLVCCQSDGTLAGGPGTCQPNTSCGGPFCTDNGVACAAGCNWGDSCSDCCSGFCNSSGVCDGFTPSDTCISDGVNCGTTCNWSDACAACCSGFCDGAGNCNEPGASAGACGDEGCGCELGNPACNDGLLCCDDGSGVTGTCATGC